MPKVIKVENLSKAYQLGDFGTGTVSRDLERFWALMRGKEDPFLKIDEINNLGKKSETNVAWGLKGINFEVELGDAIGIIGRNGAGKSTLLKILSRITSPTTGSVKVKGRVASLLEIGTGFHPELNGRENIYVNGALLGMRKAEIKRKFDEIVDFAGVERYIDTPVKRYSSGMYVRLAFAVAAHLESEILIVDEVLAVGDSEFQQKCLGKMGEVNKGEGRTILFVSHNMGAVQSLCNKGFLLNEGMNICEGKIETVLEKYLSFASHITTEKSWDIEDAPGNENAKIKYVSINALDDSKVFDVRTPLKFEAKFWNLRDKVKLNLSFILEKMDGTIVFDIMTPEINCNRGEYQGNLVIPGNFLNNGHYNINIIIGKDSVTEYYALLNCLNFKVEDYREGTLWVDTWQGAVRPTFIDFTLNKID